jgi:hypothetical protein
MHNTKALRLVASPLGAGVVEDVEPAGVIGKPPPIAIILRPRLMALKIHTASLFPSAAKELKEAI